METNISKRELAALLTLFTAVPLSAAAQDQSNESEQTQSQQQAQSESREQAQGEGRQSADQERTQLARSDSQRRSQGERKPNPFARADDSWISLSGTVDSVQPHSFTLNYGDGVVTVEMDDGDRDADAYDLLSGDQVTVYGLVDDDLFETTSIEASSVFVEKLGTYFYASSLDEEDFYVVALPAPLDPSAAAVHGAVTEVSGDEFEIDAGSRSVRVDVENLPYDPLDDEGYQKIEVGDIVSVSGSIDDDFFEGREIKADNVTTLVEEIG